MLRGMSGSASTLVSRVVAAPREALYRAFLDPDALAAWLPPDSMTGVVHAFEAREGGAFSMSLVYPDGDGPERDGAPRGKTSERTDRFQGRFARLIPNQRVVWAVAFDSADPSFAGEMTVSWTLAPEDSGTKVTVLCENIPRGIRPEDNEAGCRSTLEKLAAFVGG
ncbi:MAG: SRPBCC family protein [Kiloniellales bacterium]